MFSGKAVLRDNELQRQPRQQCPYSPNYPSTGQTYTCFFIPKNVDNSGSAVARGTGIQASIVLYSANAGNVLEAISHSSVALGSELQIAAERLSRLNSLFGIADPLPGLGMGTEHLLERI